MPLFVKAQEHYEMSGTISIKSAKTYIYKLTFTVHGTTIKGYTTTVLTNGSESKAALIGQINKDHETLTFAEAPYEAEQKNPIFCFVTATLHYVLRDQQYIISGAFKGIDNTGMYCAEGSITLKMAAKARNIFSPANQQGNLAERGITGASAKRVATKDPPGGRTGGIQIAETQQKTGRTEGQTNSGDHTGKIVNDPGVQQSGNREKYPVRERTAIATQKGKSALQDASSVETPPLKNVTDAVTTRQNAPHEAGKYMKDGQADDRNKINREKHHGERIKKSGENNGMAVEAQDTTDDLEEYTITAGIKQVFYWTTDTCILDLYDGGVIDGDIVTVYVNGEEILTKYLLAKKKKQLKLLLKQEVNSIEIVAENLGKTPPNTSNINLTDGKRIYRLRAYNDIGESAEIVLKKKKGADKVPPSRQQ